MFGMLGPAETTIVVTFLPPGDTARTQCTRVAPGYDRAVMCDLICSEQLRLVRTPPGPLPVDCFPQLHRLSVAFDRIVMLDKDQKPRPDGDTWEDVASLVEFLSQVTSYDDDPPVDEHMQCTVSQYQVVILVVLWCGQSGMAVV